MVESSTCFCNKALISSSVKPGSAPSARTYPETADPF